MIAPLFDATSTKLDGARRLIGFFLLRRSKGENGTGGAPERALGDALQKDAGQARAPVRSHHDQIGAELLGGLTNHVRDARALDDVTVAAKNAARAWTEKS